MIREFFKPTYSAFYMFAIFGTWAENDYGVELWGRLLFAAIWTALFLWGWKLYVKRHRDPAIRRESDRTERLYSLSKLAEATLAWSETDVGDEDADDALATAVENYQQFTGIALTSPA